MIGWGTRNTDETSFDRFWHQEIDPFPRLSVCSGNYDVDNEVFDEKSERYTITSACLVFPISRPTLRKRLRATGQKPDKDRTFSVEQIRIALDSGPLSYTRSIPGASSAKIEEIKARCQHIELKNAALLKDLVGRDELESELERIFGCVTSILDGSALSVRDKKELGENISSWRERLESVAHSQGSGAAAATEVVEVSTAEHRTQLQAIQDRESKARTLGWRIKNDIVMGIRLMRAECFSALELILVTIQQTIYASELQLADREALCRQISHIQTSEEVVSKLLMLCRPKELLLPSAWSEKYRLAPAGSPKAGRWHCYPFQREPMDCIADPEVSSLTMMFASQLLGKSSILESQLLWLFDQAPCTIMAVFPTHANAVTWSKNRFSPLIDSIERVAKLVDEAKPKKRGSGESTIVHKRLAGGCYFQAGGSNSPANLRAATCKVTVFDEVDAYRDSAGQDGDVIELVKQRSIRYSDAFSIQTSTPGAKGFSRIEKCYEGDASDQRKWFVKCPRCWPKSDPFVIMWDMIRWPKEKSADGKTTRHLTHLAYLQCPFCEAHLTDRDRMDMVEQGEWIATNTSVKGKRGYWANAFLVLGQCKRGFSSWLAFFADDFLAKSRLGVNGLRPWVNLFLAESYELQGDAPPFMALYNRRETYPEYEGSGEIILDEKCGMIVVGVDVQASPARLELEIVGYGEHDQTWGLEYIVVPGSPERQAVWTQLYEILHRSFRHPSGRRISPCYCCIDAGYLDNIVDRFCKNSCHRDLTVCATVGKPGFQRHWWKKSKTDPLLTLMQVDYAKELQYRRLRIEDPGSPEFCHWPSNPRCGYEPSYFEGLTIEKMLMDKAEPRFQKMNVRDRNEPLDIRVMTLCAKELANPNWVKVKAWLATPPSEEEDWRPSSERRQALLNKEIPDFRGPSASEIEEQFRAIINKNPTAKKWCNIT